MHTTRLFATLAVTLTLATISSVALGGSIRLDGIADGDTIYIEEFSDAFFRMDLYDPPPRETQQRFHAISDPSVQFGSLAFDGFPNDEDFRLGVVTFDESAAPSGTGTVPITALLLGVGTDPTDSGHVNYGRWTDIATSVNTFSGSVQLLNGLVTSIDLVADIELLIPSLGNLIVPGTFSVSGDRFDGYLEVAPFPGDNARLVWDFAGTLTTVAVPEPSTLLLASGALAALVATHIRRSRRK